MQTYIAHYSSPKASDNRAKGLFDFESSARMGSKKIQHDARLKMLELYGKEAVSYTIDRIERKSAKSTSCNEQLELDFRAPKQERKRALKKEYW